MLAGIGDEYGVAKRYTNYSQLFLGLAMAVAPVGGWLAAGGRAGWEPWLLGVAIGMWVRMIRPIIRWRRRWRVVSVDGDGAGSQAAVSSWLRANGTEVWIIISISMKIHCSTRS